VQYSSGKHKAQPEGERQLLDNRRGRKKRGGGHRSSRLPRTSELKEIPIQQAEGRFTVADGLVNLISLISSKDLILDEKGTVGLDEKLDIGIVAKVSERLTPMVVANQQYPVFFRKKKAGPAFR